MPSGNNTHMTRAVWCRPLTQTTHNQNSSKDNPFLLLVLFSFLGICCGFCFSLHHNSCLFFFHSGCHPLKFYKCCCNSLNLTQKIIALSSIKPCPGSCLKQKHTFYFTRLTFPAEDRKGRNKDCREEKSSAGGCGAHCSEQSKMR